MPEPSLPGPAVCQAIPDAILRPSLPGERQGIRQVCGVFDADGLRVQRADTWARIGQLSLDCAAPLPGGLPRRRGKWLFGGIAYPHFGHGLIFSTARLWALDHMRDLDGILFFDRSTQGQTRPEAPRNLMRLLDVYGVDLPVWTVAHPEQVDTLIVPDQGISTHKDLFNGTATYRAYIRGALDRIPPSEPAAPKLYISRRKLGFHMPGLLFEDRIEEYLSDQGYVIFHPQDHPLRTQIALCKSARQIIGVDGSALHLAAFAADPRAQVAVLGRRPYFPGAICGQIRAFSGAEATEIHAYDGVFAPETAQRNGRLWLRALCQTNFGTLHQSLVRDGFISDCPAWTGPGPKRIARRLQRAAARGTEPFIPVPKALWTAQS